MEKFTIIEITKRTFLILLGTSLHSFIPIACLIQYFHDYKLYDSLSLQQHIHGIIYLGIIVWFWFFMALIPFSLLLFGFYALKYSRPNIDGRYKLDILMFLILITSGISMCFFYVFDKEATGIVASIFTSLTFILNFIYLNKGFDKQYLNNHHPKNSNPNILDDELI